MGYLHINNLYKDQTILLFKECYALEKIHGTSAHVRYIPPVGGEKGRLVFFSGGESHDKFVKVFGDEWTLLEKFFASSLPTDRETTLFGEAYGGKQQGMSATYGSELKFVVFDVKVGDSWLEVPKAEAVANALGLEFIHYTRIPTTLEALDAARDADSVQAVRNGVGAGKKMEGVVLRPIIEVTLNNGSRVIAKHKRDEFKETSTPRKVVDPALLQVLTDAEAIATEWVTPMRLTHVLDKIPGHCMEKMQEIIAAMNEDVFREGAGEIVDTKEVRKAISKRAAVLYKDSLKAALTQSQTIG
jgi:hypothetical protein